MPYNPPPRNAEDSRKLAEEKGRSQHKLLQRLRFDIDERARCGEFKVTTWTRFACDAEIRHACDVLRAQDYIVNWHSRHFLWINWNWITVQW